jgi:hypothetical protein
MRTAIRMVLLITKRLCSMRRTKAARRAEVEAAVEAAVEALAEVEAVGN